MGTRRTTIAIASLQLLLVLFVQVVPLIHAVAGAQAGFVKKAGCHCTDGECCAAMAGMAQECRCEGSCAANRHTKEPDCCSTGEEVPVISCGCCNRDPLSPAAVPLIKWECIPPVFILEAGVTRCTVNLSSYSGMRTAFRPEPSIPPPEA